MRKRGSIVAKLMAQNLSKSGFCHIITLDLHQKEIQGFFECPVDNLRNSYLHFFQIMNFRLLCHQRIFPKSHFLLRRMHSVYIQSLNYSVNKNLDFFNTIIIWNFFPRFISAFHSTLGGFLG